jgi:hypothetical protein
VGESMNGPWSESRDAGNPHVRFDERDLETGPSRSPRQISTLLGPIGCKIFKVYWRHNLADKLAYNGMRSEHCRGSYPEGGGSPSNPDFVQIAGRFAAWAASGGPLEVVAAGSR